MIQSYLSRQASVDDDTMMLMSVKDAAKKGIETEKRLRYFDSEGLLNEVAYTVENMRQFLKHKVAFSMVMVFNDGTEKVCIKGFERGEVS